MTDLVAFIEARLSEDQERVERGQWMAQFLSQGGRKDPGSRGAYAKAIEREGGYSPARVLREVAAKRRIVKEAGEANGLDASLDLERRTGRRDETIEPFVGDVILRALASAWSDHPDYRAEWAL